MCKLILALRWLFVSLWYGLIWSLSAQPVGASDALSDEVITGALVSGTPNMPMAGTTVQAAVTELLSFFVRKAAHIFLFFVLALLIWAALAPFLKKQCFHSASTVLLTLTLAALDEYHQTLVPGRSGEFRDILVDLSGILIALLLLALPFFAQKLHRAKCVWLLGLLCGGCLLIYVGRLEHLPQPFALRVPHLSLFMRLTETDRAALLTSCISPLRDLLFLLSCIVTGFLPVCLATLSGQKSTVTTAFIAASALSSLTALLWGFPFLPSLLSVLFSGLMAMVLLPLSLFFTSRANRFPLQLPKI